MQITFISTTKLCPDNVIMHISWITHQI